MVVDVLSLDLSLNLWAKIRLALVLEDTGIVTGGCEDRGTITKLVVVYDRERILQFRCGVSAVTVQLQCFVSAVGLNLECVCGHHTQYWGEHLLFVNILSNEGQVLGVCSLKPIRTWYHVRGHPGHHSRPEEIATLKAIRLHTATVEQHGGALINGTLNERLRTFEGLPNRIKDE